MNNATMGFDRERHGDVVAVAEAIGLPSAETIALIQAFGPAIVGQATAEASQAGDKLYSPPAFVKRRARQLYDAKVAAEAWESRRSNSVDRERDARLGESKQAERAVLDEQGQLSAIPYKQLEELRATALELLPPVVRQIAAKRGFAQSSAWRSQVLLLWKQRLDAAGG